MNHLVVEMTGQFFAAGAKTVILADTIGAATPAQVKSLYGRLIAEFGAENLGAHFHDTRGFGVADAYAALEAGIRKFDASIGGLGGCPFAPGATGNVATEDIALLFEKMGFDTGVDFEQPGPRLRDYVLAVKACFSAFRGERLDHQGDFYELTFLNPHVSFPHSELSSSSVIY